MTTSKQFQYVWLERAGDPRFPPWLRVMALAYGSHHQNLHARFTPGEMSRALATPNRAGELVPMNRSNLQRAIRAAIQLGVIDASSGSLCLVVPAHKIHSCGGGMEGRPEDPCPLENHHRSALARRRKEGA